MLEIADVSRAVAAYQSGETSLGQFADWLRAVSRRKFAESEEVRNAILEVDALFSEMDFGEMSEIQFREELAKAARPFVSLEVSTSPMNIPMRNAALTLNMATAAAVAVALCLPPGSGMALPQNRWQPKAEAGARAFVEVGGGTLMGTTGTNALDLVSLRSI
jgi:hypothetical protein